MSSSLLVLYTLLVVSYLLTFCSGHEVIELQSTNFELTVTTYKYIAILFYDESSQGQKLMQSWLDGGLAIKGNLPTDCEMSKINGNDPELKEILDAYAIRLPSIKVFRRGVFGDYRGPLDAEGIASFVPEDCKPSVHIVHQLSDLKSALENTKQTTVFGLFRDTDIVEEEGEGYSIEPWGQFSSAADSLRGHAVFFAITEPDIIRGFNVKRTDLPLIYILSSDGEGLLKYTGEILESNLSEWVLRNSAPTMDELTLDTNLGEVYATQFFSSRKLKFILFIQPDMVDSGVLDYWRELSDFFTGKAIFSYMIQSAVPDVVEYFSINIDEDVPVIAAHQPTNDSRYKSRKLDVTNRVELLEFVTGVMDGTVPKILKSEAVPKKNHGPVFQLVGDNLLQTVSKVDTDVLLAIYVPNCVQCKKLLPTFDLLGRAVQAESRIMVAKIDATANDIPVHWGVKSYPALLWFPAADKPYKENTMPAPKPYWDAGISLQELVRFVQRESSFDMKSLRVATMEQVGSLLADEDSIRQKYEDAERTQRRNEGRVVYEDETVDWLLGEVAFDGKRWHVVVAGLFVVSWMAMLVYISVLQSRTQVKKQIMKAAMSKKEDSMPVTNEQEEQKQEQEEVPQEDQAESDSSDLSSCSD